jgi:hypothetical protein
MLRGAATDGGIPEVEELLAEEPVATALGELEDAVALEVLAGDGLLVVSGCPELGPVFELIDLVVDQVVEAWGAGLPICGEVCPEFEQEVDAFHAHLLGLGDDVDLDAGESFAAVLVVEPECRAVLGEPAADGGAADLEVFDYDYGLLAASMAAGMDSVGMMSSRKVLMVLSCSGLRGAR